MSSWIATQTAINSINSTLDLLSEDEDDKRLSDVDSENNDSIDEDNKDQESNEQKIYKKPSVEQVDSHSPVKTGILLFLVATLVVLVGFVVFENLPAKPAKNSDILEGKIASTSEQEAIDKEEDLRNIDEALTQTLQCPTLSPSAVDDAANREIDDVDETDTITDTVTSSNLVSGDSYRVESTIKQEPRSTSTILLTELWSYWKDFWGFS